MRHVLTAKLLSDEAHIPHGCGNMGRKHHPRFRSVSIPTPLVEAVERYVEDTGLYTSKAEFVNESIRARLKIPENATHCPYCGRKMKKKV